MISAPHEIKSRSQLIVIAAVDQMFLGQTTIRHRCNDTIVQLLYTAQQTVYSSQQTLYSSQQTVIAPQ